MALVAALLLASGLVPSAASAEQATEPQCPCSIWDPASAVPALVDSDDPSAVELGVKFTADTSGFITGVRFYKAAANTGQHRANLWSASGTLLATTTFTNESASGWQEVSFGSPVSITAGVVYVASYHTETGHYSADDGYFATGGVDNGPLHAPGDATTRNGVYHYGTSGFPDSSWQSSNYWVDIVFEAALESDSTPPDVAATTPAANATNVSPRAAIVVSFSEAIDPATVTTSTIELRNAANTLVTSTVAYDGPARRATVIPSVQLAYGSSYSVRVRGGVADPRIKDAAGNALAADVTWSFSTMAAAACPCSIWNPSIDVPAVVDVADASAIELGVKFRSDSSGYITGLRFYKSAANTGTHLANLWSASGALLATATFTNETASGWQEVRFPAAVAITANSIYIASYHTDTGHYSASRGYFSTQGVDTPPLHAQSNASLNGVYRYGTSGFPGSSFQATNYWVDVVYDTAIPVDFVPPTVVSTTPAAGATNVAPTTPIKATFSEPMDVTTVSTSTFDLRTSAGVLVPAAVTYDAASRTATLTPSTALAANSTYTAQIRGGNPSPRVLDLAGNPMGNPVTWSFTTGAAATCPCSLWNPALTMPHVIDSGDGNAVELGVKFRTAMSGYITGLRFYKSAANTGTHTGTLWSPGGVRLATATFVNETASGWQQVIFGNPVAVSPQFTYVVSYHTDAGHYSVDENYFVNAVDAAPLSAPSNVTTENGVYVYGASAFPQFSFRAANYWVDPIFTTFIGEGDPLPPVVTAVSPAPGSTISDASANVLVTFSKPMWEQTINVSTIELRDATSALVAGSVTYSSISRQVKFDPAAPLVIGATYTIVVKGGVSDPRVKDLVGNALASTFTSTFTISALNCPCSLWPATSVPEIVDVIDDNAVELGQAFQAQVDGFVTGVRFYKSAANIGVHTGSLWTSTGTLLATATFSGETQSGWQEARFASPVAIRATERFVVSYHTNTGHYSATPWFFWTGPQGFQTAFGTPPLYTFEAGRYRYGSSGFPTSTYNSTNYWVDVVFEK